MARTTISIPDWMEAELKARQTDGRSEHIREALISRWLEEDAGEWDTPDVDATTINLASEREALPDGGTNE